MAYGKILPKDILDLPPFGCINIHVSLLPRWRGAAPIEHSLMNGDKETGISIIQLIEKLDAGPIINQKKVDIDDDCNKNELSQKLTEVGIKLLVETIPLIFDKKISYFDQNDNGGGNSSSSNNNNKRKNDNVRNIIKKDNYIIIFFWKHLVFLSIFYDTQTSMNIYISEESFLL